MLSGDFLTLLERKCQKWRSFPKPVKFVFMFLRYWKRHLILLRKKVFFASASWLFFLKREINSWARQNFFIFKLNFFVAAKMINKKKRGNYFWYFKTYLCRAQSSKRVVQAVTWTAVTVEKVKKKILGRKLSRQEKNDKRRLKLKMVYN